MRGFVLAAGFGTRMRPLTDHIPKALVPVCGKPLLERSLQFVNNSGIDIIGVNAHYLPEQIVEFKNRSKVPFELFIESGEIRGTGGAFDYARKFLSDDNSFFMLNVDIVCQFDLKSAIRKFEASDALCTLIAFPCAEGKGTILFDKCTKGYIGTPADTSSRTSDTAEAAFIGAALYKKEFLDLVTTDDFSIVPVWKRAVANGLIVTVDIQKNGFWYDIGNIKSLADFHFEYIDKKIDVEIPHDYYLDNVKSCVYPFACVNHTSEKSIDHSWIGTSLFSGSTIEHSIIWPGTDVRDLHIVNSLYTPFGAINIV